MVDVADLSKAASLQAELGVIENGLAVLEAGGRITVLTAQYMKTEGDRQILMSGTLPVGRMTYPPQMLDAIKQFATEHIQELRDELAALGVTGASEGRAAATPPKTGARK